MNKLREMQAQKEQQQERHYCAVVRRSGAGDSPEAERPVFGELAVRYRGRIRIHYGQ
jgi:hypothetical protein